MRKIQIVGLAIFAVLALGAMTAASAFGADEFLAGGNAITVFPLATDSTGELLLEDMEASIKVDVLCSGLFAGEIESKTLALILEVVSLTGTTTIDCEDMTGVCEGKLAELVAENLPWDVNLELMTNGQFLLDFPTTAAYKVVCKTILGTFEDLCEGLTSALQTNVATGVESTFNEESEPGECTGSPGKKAGLVEGSGITTDTGDGSILSVS
jgi:hypothetical protein